jgi:hypothetical protein
LAIMKAPPLSVIEKCIAKGQCNQQEKR